MTDFADALEQAAASSRPTAAAPPITTTRPEPSPAPRPETRALAAAPSPARIAARLRELADAHRVALRDDPALVAALARHDVTGSIPAELYRAVAEALAWVHRMESEAEAGG